MAYFQTGNDEGIPLRRYRCVYCKSLVKDRMRLPAHEAHCDARFIVERGWRLELEKAKRREAAAGARR